MGRPLARLDSGYCGGIITSSEGKNERLADSSIAFIETSSNRSCLTVKLGDNNTSKKTYYTCDSPLLRLAVMVHFPIHICYAWIALVCWVDILLLIVLVLWIGNENV